MSHFRLLLSQSLSGAATLISNVITLPYYQLYRQITLLPILSIAASIENGEPDQVISHKFRSWKEKKSSEFQLVQVAGTLLAAAVIGCFSWDSSQNPHWVGPAAWYCSLILSFSSVLLASSQSFIFKYLNDAAIGGQQLSLGQELAMVVAVRGPTQPVLSGAHRSVFVRWNLVFVWQAPTMMMAYSVMGYVIGLIVYVSAPLYNQESFDGSSKGAVIFLVCAGISGGVFTWSSYWGYRFHDGKAL